MPQTHAPRPRWSRQLHGVPNASSARVRKRPGALAKELWKRKVRRIPVT